MRCGAQQIHGRPLFSRFRAEEGPAGERRVHAHRLMCAPHSNPKGRSMSLVFRALQGQGTGPLVNWTHQARSQEQGSLPNLHLCLLAPFLGLEGQFGICPSFCCFCSCLGRDQTCSIMQKMRGNLSISRAKKALSNLMTTPGT